jgi:putative ABC transport system permease protein
MGTFWQDVKYAARMLLKNPGFTIVGIVTLALGIGANTAIFSIINSVLLRPLPFAQPGQLVQLWETEGAPGNYPLTGPDYLDWQSQNQSMEAMSLFSWGRGMNANAPGSGSDIPEPASVINTQANFFSLLGVHAKLGRTFADGEDQPGKNHVAVLSNGFWLRQFGGRSDALGQGLQLNGQSYTVIGVMPAWYNFPSANPSPTDIWTPLDMSPHGTGTRGSHQWRAIGRMKKGFSVPQAQADLETIAKRLAKSYPGNNDDVNAVVVPLQKELGEYSRQPLLILLGAVGLVLLVACANVANLLLARASGRQREIAVRASLGATRWRLVRQMLTESVMLSLAGATLGLLGAYWAVATLQGAKSLPVPRVNPIQLDVAVLLFTIAVSILVGVLFGLAPALQVSQLNLTEELKSSAQSVVGATSGRRLLRDALVVGEIAVSLALLVGAGLLLRSFARLRNFDIGVQTQNILTMGLNLPPAKYKNLPARREFYDLLLARIEQTPGVQSAAVSTEIPLQGGSNGYITVAGETNPALATELVEWNYITSDYFKTFAIPLVQGSIFSPEDVDHAAENTIKVDALYEAAKGANVTIPPDLTFVAVINRKMAELYWPNQNPIDKIFNASGTNVKVIGVVGDVKQGGIRDSTMPQAYFPLALILDAPGFGVRLTVRSAVAPASVLSSIRNDVRQLDGGLAIFRAVTMQDVIAEDLQDTSIQTFLLGIFAGLGLLLAAVGTYSVMAYLVSQRTHEIGVRMALGAQRRDVLQLVIGQGTKLALLGVGVGFAISLMLTKLLSSMLFGVSPRDPVTFGGVAILLVSVALLACYIPARRAMRVDPMVALRYE